MKGTGGLIKISASDWGLTSFVQQWFTEELGAEDTTVIMALLLPYKWTELCEEESRVRDAFQWNPISLCQKQRMEANGNTKERYFIKFRVGADAVGSKGGIHPVSLEA